MKDTFDNRCTVFVMTRDVSLNQCYCTSFFFRKFWPDCPFEFVLCTESKEPKENLFDRVIKVGTDLVWGERLDILLRTENINTPFVLFLLEDFYLKDYVDSSEVYECIDLLEKTNGGAVRLNPPAFRRLSYNDRFDLQPTTSIYRISGQPTVFSTEYLRIFAEKHYTPWDFERKGYYLSRALPNEIFCVRRTVMDVVSAWTRGCWMPEAYRMMVEEQIDPSLYEGKPTYSAKMLLYDKFAYVLIWCFPHIITWVRTHFNADAKKLKK